MQVSLNTAENSGGGIFLSQLANITIFNTIFQGDVAPSNQGSALYLALASVKQPKLVFEGYSCTWLPQVFCIDKDVQFDESESEVNLFF